MSTDFQHDSSPVTVELPAVPARFASKVVVITGASPYGIGGAIAVRLAREGAALWLMSRGDPGELMEKIEPFKHKVVWSGCDVTDQRAVDQSRDACLDEFGQIDVLVNNAGIETASSFEDLSDEEWDELVDVNLTGVMRTTRAMLPALKERGGVVVNVSSCTAMGGTPGLVAYSATKAGLNGMTQSLALEMADQGVRVVGVAPALVRTPMAARHVQRLTAEAWEKLQDCHPLGIGVTQDVAAAVAFLASNEARWISGITLPLGWMPSYPLPFWASEPR
ncbi:MAG: SDR family oxidoreductase [Planctomycetales bacterium]|nr:SDR family oxidoreductase [Planctomycetales bacterium]NIM09009.1 SDR family oxidoreductase [Planctomycetales bacterium]NIN08472.1 SDR family oxidoreductase [Planctomycetales bacterium]NIN77606.1 SDR family oxidoreductase [Planctomycetales bacterium]NIO34771.1 SDR family oxidoreductase [Planctomycetales bacterium]